jgi:ribA/ribD-fused uncharacterized protein
MVAAHERALLDELMQRAEHGERIKAVYFWGHTERPGGVTAACLSQWYPAAFEVDGQRYAHAEQFMMAEKARLFGDEAARQAILQTDKAGAVKALGRGVQGFDDAVWEAERFGIVLHGSVAKFGQNAALGEFLLGTGERLLVEASPVDRIWGIGLAADDERAKDPRRWRGLNLLGFALMQAREALRS